MYYAIFDQNIPVRIPARPLSESSGMPHHQAFGYTSAYKLKFTKNEE